MGLSQPWKLLSTSCVWLGWGQFWSMWRGRKSSSQAGGLLGKGFLTDTIRTWEETLLPLDIAVSSFRVWIRGSHLGTRRGDQLDKLTMAEQDEKKILASWRQPILSKSTESGLSVTCSQNHPIWFYPLSLHFETHLIKLCFEQSGLALFICCAPLVLHGDFELMVYGTMGTVCVVFLMFLTFWGFAELPREGNQALQTWASPLLWFSSFSHFKLQGALSTCPSPYFPHPTVRCPIAFRSYQVIPVIMCLRCDISQRFFTLNVMSKIRG